MLQSEVKGKDDGEKKMPKSLTGKEVCPSKKKYNTREEGEERRRGKGGSDNDGGIERLEHCSGVNPLNLISV